MEEFVDDEGHAAVRRRLATLQSWLFDFPQLEVHRDLDATCGLDRLDETEIARKIIEIAEEICDRKIAPSPGPASANDAWSAIGALIRDCGLADEDLDETGIDPRDRRYRILRSLLCHALSDRCGRQHEYVSRIMAMELPDVQQEIMRILQENAQRGNVEEDDGETADYSFLVDGGAASVSASFACENDGDAKAKRDRSEAFGDESVHAESPRDKIHRAEDEDEDSPLEHEVDGCNATRRRRESRDADELRADVAKLRLQIEQCRRQEIDLTTKLDEEQSRHRADMLQAESKHLKEMRDLEEKLGKEILQQRRDLEALRDCERSAKEMREENARLRDDLDVLECSKEKLAHSEEQLRRCRERIESVGDAHDALLREEKAHAASVDRCVALENELAQLKPLRRQLEEYRVRATEAEVALAESREDLRRFKEKSSGLEGANRALKRGVDLQQAEAGNLQRRLQEEGGEPGKEGAAVGVGMSELNPELMEELKTLRSEYARLKEFESKREVDFVQRLEESCDDAKRLSERYKEQFFQTKSELEDTQKLLRESETREAKLMEEVDDWSDKYKQLGEDYCHERIKSHKAALDAERNFQNQIKGLKEKGRQDLQALEERLTLKIDTERKQHKEKIDRADTQRMEMENNHSEQLAALREHSSKTLRAAKEQAERRYEVLEQSKRAEMQNIEQSKRDEIEKLTTKGKAMLRESRQKAKDLKRKITEEYEVEISSQKEDLERIKYIQEEYEAKAMAKIAKRDQQIGLLETRILEAKRANDELEDKIKKTERNSKELAGDNDRLRRQLGSRFGSGGASQAQLEELMSVCKSLREENRRLKAADADRLLSAGSVCEPPPKNDHSDEVAPSFSKSALVEYREEYERRIEEMVQERRDLVMKASAAASETQKAEKRSWELEQELAKIKSELTTARLALQRNERHREFLAGPSSGGKRRYEAIARDERENNTPNIRSRATLPPSGAIRRDFTPHLSAGSNSKKRTEQSLMELTSRDNADPAGAAPECQQS